MRFRGGKLVANLSSTVPAKRAPVELDPRPPTPALGGNASAAECSDMPSAVTAIRPNMVAQNSANENDSFFSLNDCPAHPVGELVKGPLRPAPLGLARSPARGCSLALGEGKERAAGAGNKRRSSAATSTHSRPVFAVPVTVYSSQRSCFVVMVSPIPERKHWGEPQAVPGKFPGHAERGQRGFSLSLCTLAVEVRSRFLQGARDPDVLVRWHPEMKGAEGHAMMRVWVRLGGTGTCAALGRR